MTERLIDNADTGFREAWDDAHSKTEPLARIGKDALADPKRVCWTSEWMRNRWKPEKVFGSFR